LNITVTLYGLFLLVECFLATLLVPFIKSLNSQKLMYLFRLIIIQRSHYQAHARCSSVNKCKPELNNLMCQLVLGDVAAD